MVEPQGYKYQYRHIGTYHPRFQAVYKQVRGDQHLYQKLDAWAWNLEALEYWEGLGAETLVVEDLDDGCVYEVEMEIMMEDGVPIDHGTHGKQLALPRSQWSKQDLGDEDHDGHDH